MPKNRWMKIIRHNNTAKTHETSEFSFIRQMSKSNCLRRVETGEVSLHRLSHSIVYNTNYTCHNKIARHWKFETKANKKKNGKQCWFGLPWEMWSVAVDKQILPKQIGWQASMVGSGENTANQWNEVCRLRQRTHVPLSSEWYCRNIANENRWHDFDSLPPRFMLRWMNSSIAFIAPFTFSFAQMQVVGIQIRPGSQLNLSINLAN